MPVCDVCNKEMNWEEGYVLTTSQVPTSEAYWENAFKGAWSYTHGMDPEGGTVAMLAQQQAGQTSGWLVCEDCSGLFSFDREQAKIYAKTQNGNPPGSGPAPVDAVAKAAANVWKRLYGSRPSSIQMADSVPAASAGPSSQPGVAPEEKKSDSSCFIATAVYGTPYCFELDVLRDFRDNILLKNRVGIVFVSIYYRIGPFLAEKVAAVPAVKSICRTVFDRIILPVVCRLK